ncbi:hypothetical protein WN48_05050 [Eufriesea mexicana]|nr:hypothetical protein WN48_05050 [Eufriesea mexicana]
MLDSRDHRSKKESRESFQDGTRGRDFGGRLVDEDVDLATVARTLLVWRKVDWENGGGNRKQNSAIQFSFKMVLTSQEDITFESNNVSTPVDHGSRTCSLPKCLGTFSWQLNFRNQSKRNTDPQARTNHPLLPSTYILGLERVHENGKVYAILCLRRQRSVLCKNRSNIWAKRVSKQFPIPVEILVFIGPRDPYWHEDWPSPALPTAGFPRFRFFPATLVSYPKLSIGIPNSGLPGSNWFIGYISGRIHEFSLPVSGCQRNPIPRSARASRNEAALEFECPEEFGYYPHPRDCTQYYVCVFGGALLESCTGGLMYSHELQTCDWPRNVGCPGGGSPSKETEEDPLLESVKIHDGAQLAKPIATRRSFLLFLSLSSCLLRHLGVLCFVTVLRILIQRIAEAVRLRVNSAVHQRRADSLPKGLSGNLADSLYNRALAYNEPGPPTLSAVSRGEHYSPRNRITEKQIRQRQQARNYHEDEYEPASEIESDRQQRVYRGQPSTIGQVQRDRDGLRRNVISEREKESLVSTRAQPEAHYRTQVPSSESPRVAKILASTVAPVISKSYYNDPDQSYPYYTIYDEDVSIYKDDDYNQYTVNQSVPVQPSVKISEVSAKQYQKPKKVAVNEADKYNLNQDVTVQDYDIYENQVRWKVFCCAFRKEPDVNRESQLCRFSVSPPCAGCPGSAQQEQVPHYRRPVVQTSRVRRPNVLSHPVVHVTTPNAIVDTFIPLTTTTQPPTTTNRPYTVNAPSRGRPQQIHRGTAPPLTVQRYHRGRWGLEREERAILEAEADIRSGGSGTSRSTVAVASRRGERTWLRRINAARKLIAERSRPTLKPSTEIVSKAQEFVDIYRYPPTRPAPIYPTPQVDKPAAKCRKDVCLLPDCCCGGADIPGGIPVEQTPQIVLLTFDDAVNDLNKPLYTDLFENGRKNPNGCPISATFYVSHEWTDYSQVQNLYANGHEMASHTVSDYPRCHLCVCAVWFPLSEVALGERSWNASLRGDPLISRAANWGNFYSRRPLAEKETGILNARKKRAANLKTAIVYSAKAIRGSSGIAIKRELQGTVGETGDYLPEEIPQIVLLTFDDSVNDLNKGLYADLFEKGRKNPNGCPISATFYVSHEWTDYSQVQNLYASGHEIASHTVSHSFGEQFSQRKWAREVAGQREILSAYGGVKLEDVRGMRAPFLSVGGNNMFKMLWDTNFTYDSSMPIYENRPPSWPYTLDYKLFHDCMIPPCPTRSYPGLWEVPMVMWQDLNGGRCSMGDACSNPPTADGVYKMLIKNFERHYTTNRAPFGLFYHAAWFTQPHHKEGFISFLDTIVAMDDVWIVTNWQAIQWVRNPTPLPLLHTFESFGCNYPDRPKKCNNPKVCNLWHKSGVRYMKTCQTCPDIYPWTGKTGIRSSRIDNDVDAHE